MLFSSTTIKISKLLSMTEVKRKGVLHYGVILTLMVGGQPRRNSVQIALGPRKPVS
jgi:hypothetical protein